MSVGTEFPAGSIDYQCSLDRDVSYLVSCRACIGASIHGIPSSGPLLCLAIYEWEEFRRNTCCSIGAVSGSETIVDAHIHCSDGNQVSVSSDSFCNGAVRALDRLQKRGSHFSIIGPLE